MCDHYDSYYRMTPEEEREYAAAQKREAERRAKFEEERKMKLTRAFGRKFGYKYETAEKIIEEWEFLKNWRD